MTQTISSTDEGNIIRVPGDFDMSPRTDLILTFTNPNDGATFVKSELIGGKVTLGTIEVFDENIKETLPANEYVEYIIETPLPFEIGFPWLALLTYVKDNASPPLRISGKYPGRFKVCQGG